MKDVTKHIERLRAIKPRLTKSDWKWISSGEAEDELARAFSLPSEAASMLLHGLVATGLVHALDSEGELIDLDECTVAKLEGKPKSVEVEEFRFWLGSHSVLPEGPEGRDRLIAQKLAAGIVPPRTIPWKKFCDDVRNECRGWIGNGVKRKPALGFSDKQIQRPRCPNAICGIM